MSRERSTRICGAILDAMAPPFDAEANPPSWLIVGKGVYEMMLARRRPSEG